MMGKKDFDCSFSQGLIRRWEQHFNLEKVYIKKCQLKQKIRVTNIELAAVRSSHFL